MTASSELLTAPTSRLFKMQLPLSHELEKHSQACIRSLKTSILVGSEEEKVTAAKNLCDFPIAVLQYVCLHASFIKNFCETDPLFIKLLSEKLKKAKQPSMHLSSMDKKEKRSVLELYIGVEFERLAVSRDEYKGNHREVLDQACELGLNDALMVRCNTAIKTLENKSASHAEREKAILSIQHDTQQLSNLYWAYGYVQAGFILKRVGDLLLSNKESDQGKTFIETAVKYFLCAYLLKDHEDSNKILNNITSDKGITTIFERHNLAFPSWEKVQATFMEWIGKDNYVVVEKRAQMEVGKAAPKTEIRMSP